MCVFCTHLGMHKSVQFHKKCFFSLLFVFCHTYICVATMCVALPQPPFLVVFAHTCVHGQVYFLSTIYLTTHFVNFGSVWWSAHYALGVCIKVSEMSVLCFLLDFQATCACSQVYELMFRNFNVTSFSAYHTLGDAKMCTFLRICFFGDVRFFFRVVSPWCYYTLGVR
jgi:hypothetical protein